MRFSEINQRWNDFLARDVDMTVHEHDVMYNAAQRPEDYAYVGLSGLEVISSVLGLAPTTKVQSILDFGCGHGRVARYIRAFFPDARMTFAEVDKSCVDFCAKQFNGRAIQTPKDFSQLQFDDKYDLIWLGSVFTHMDYARMEILFKKLFASLSPNGVVIGTFRGEKMYHTYLRNPEVAKRDADLIQQFESTGVAYKRYPGWEDDWGLSLVMPHKLIELGQRTPEARLVTFAEVAWANAHDVAAWTNTSPQTIIR